jgi:hypothetical protein
VENIDTDRHDWGAMGLCVQWKGVARRIGKSDNLENLMD